LFWTTKRIVIWLERRFWKRTFVDNEKGEDIEHDTLLMRQLLDENNAESEAKS